MLLEMFFFLSVTEFSCILLENKIFLSKLYYVGFYLVNSRYKLWYCLSNRSKCPISGSLLCKYARIWFLYTYHQVSYTYRENVTELYYVKDDAHLAFVYSKNKDIRFTTAFVHYTHLLAVSLLLSLLSTKGKVFASCLWYKQNSLSSSDLIALPENIRKFRGQRLQLQER